MEVAGLIYFCYTICITPAKDRRLPMIKNIVILGAGFGGLRVALNVEADIRRYLRGSTPEAEEWKVILIDRNPYHLYYPKLYDIAVPEGAEPSPAIEIREILKGTRVEFVQGEVQRVDCKARVVEVTPSPDLRSSSPEGVEDGPSERRPRGGKREGLSYEYLVLALGADTDFFGIEGLQEYGCTLKSVSDAQKIRTMIEQFLKVPDKKLEIMIGGAGATGVEVAAELAHLFRNISRDRWSVTIVEALPRILSMFPLALSQYAHLRLERLGVHLMLDTCIKKVDSAHSREIATSPTAPRNDGAVIEVILAPRPLKPGEKEEELTCEFLPEHEKLVRADLLLWAGGIRPNPLMAQCGLPVDKKGRVEVDEHMAVRNLENVFAIGDNAFLLDPVMKQPVPAIAQAALLEAKIVAENITATIKGRLMKLYPFPKFPAIVPLGNKDAVALVGTHVVRGFSAWFLRQAADFRYYNSILPWWRAIKLCFFR